MPSVPLGNVLTCYLIFLSSLFVSNQTATQNKNVAYLMVRNTLYLSKISLKLHSYIVSFSAFKHRYEFIVENN